MRTVCLLVILVAACKTDKQEAKPTPPPVPEVAKQTAPPPVEAAAPAPRVVKPAGGINTQAQYEAMALELTDKIIVVFSAAGTNCEKLAGKLEQFITENKAPLAATDEFETANPFAEDDLEPKLQTRVSKLVQTMGVSLAACENDQRVQAAMAKLPD